MGQAALAVDADMVLDLPQSLLLAENCATERTWGPIVECFVLVMALCGPGEAAGLFCDCLVHSNERSALRMGTELLPRISEQLAP